MQKTFRSAIAGIVFITIQFGGIGIILFTGPIIHGNPFLLIIEMFGIVLGLWAIFAMKIDNVSILPDIKKNAQFVSQGPYCLIRHPMYTAIFLFLLPLIINAHNFFRLLVFTIILFDLFFKSVFEEYLLKNHFEYYQNYIKRTYRFLPFIF